MFVFFRKVAYLPPGTDYGSWAEKRKVEIPVPLQ